MEKQLDRKLSRYYPIEMKPDMIYDALNQFNDLVRLFSIGVRLHRNAVKFPT